MRSRKANRPHRVGSESRQAGAPTSALFSRRKGKHGGFLPALSGSQFRVMKPSFTATSSSAPKGERQKENVLLPPQSFLQKLSGEIFESCESKDSAFLALFGFSGGGTLGFGGGHFLTCLKIYVNLPVVESCCDPAFSCKGLRHASRLAAFRRGRDVLSQPQGTPYAVSRFHCQSKSNALSDQTYRA